jgi:hypothetical protein
MVTVSGVARPGPRSSITLLANDPANPMSSFDVLPGLGHVTATEGDLYFCVAVRVLECGPMMGEPGKPRRTIQVVDVDDEEDGPCSWAEKCWCRISCAVLAHRQRG